MIDQINTLDPRSLNGLKLAAKENSPEAVKAAAKQFEAMFLQIVLKTMRESLPKDGMMDSDATRFYQGLYDQQLAGVMAQRGGVGLAQALERQMLGQAHAASGTSNPSNVPGHLVPRPPVGALTPDADAQEGGAQEIGALALGTPEMRAAEMRWLELRAAQSRAAEARTATGTTAAAGASSAATTPSTSSTPTPSTDQRSFVEQLWPQAQEAARQLGVPPHFLVAQAALETGWGKAEIRGANGQPSYNLFNIKATKDWTGPTVDAVTTEYVNGIPQTSVERFRAYGSYAESFQDFARLMQTSPRYAKVAGSTDAGSFARALQSGGYATDPAYADKLTRVINGNTLRQSLIASNRA